MTGKQRHGCLTALLIWMIIANSLTALLYLFGSAALQEQLPTMPHWVFPILALLSIVNLVCTIALFSWKKWGFFGFAGSAAIIFIINVAVGLGIFQTLLGLAGVVLLYGVLQIGKEEKKGWSQLE